MNDITWITYYNNAFISPYVHPIIVQMLKLDLQAPLRRNISLTNTQQTMLAWETAFVSDYSQNIAARLTESAQNSPFLLVNSVNPAHGDSSIAFLHSCNLLVTF